MFYSPPAAKAFLGILNRLARSDFLLLTRNIPPSHQRFRFLFLFFTANFLVVIPRAELGGCRAIPDRSSDVMVIPFARYDVIIMRRSRN